MGGVNDIADVISQAKRKGVTYEIDGDLLMCTGDERAAKELL